MGNRVGRGKHRFICLEFKLIQQALLGVVGRFLTGYEDAVWHVTLPVDEKTALQM
jgi:hypothetical protein